MVEYDIYLTSGLKITAVAKTGTDVAKDFENALTEGAVGFSVSDGGELVMLFQMEHVAAVVKRNE